MQIFNSFKSLTQTQCSITLAAGFFDGLHLGHKRLIECAKECEGKTIALTFNKHPEEIFSPRPFPLLSTLEDRINRLALLDVYGVLVLNFTQEFAQISAESFAKSIAQIPNIKTIVSGQNWRFGNCAQGTPEYLNNFVQTITIPYVTKDAEIISSSRIRALLQSGNIEKANELLGYEYSVKGTIVKGRQIARKYDFKTANFANIPTLLPMRGAYIVSSQIDGTTYRGVGAVTMRPTFQNTTQTPLLEVHYLDFPNTNLYGKNLQVTFHKKLRDEQKFSSPQELFAQIKRDAQEARKWTP